MYMPSFNWDRCKKYVINLDRREDRAKLVFKQFSDHGINVLRWKATDWKDVVVPELSIKRKEKNAAGILACSLSHVSLYKEAIKNKYDYIFVSEDDVELCDDFNDRMKYVESLGFDFDMLYCGGHFDNFDTDLQPTLVNTLYLVNNMAGTYSYIIKRSVMEFIERNIYYRWGLDEFISHEVLPRFICIAFIPFLAGHLSGYSDVAMHNADYNCNQYYKKEKLIL